MKIINMAVLTVLSSAIVVLTGCGTTQNYAAAVNTWQGAPASALLRTWGQPEEESTASNGNRVYVYRTVEHETVSKAYAENPMMRISPQKANALSRPSASVHHDRYAFVCDTEFEVNHADMIVKVTFHGNDCITSSGNAKRWTY